ncbi:MAG: hypothetical protein IPP77_03365 [Bacteroidetes bacterium]|nr:hypothetical protein [Bacteroidota bacterium]
MKKPIVLFIFSLVLTLVHAQEGNNICVWNAMNNYNTGGGPEELETAIKCSDEASVHEGTSLKSKTWLYRGQLFTTISTDKVLKTKYPTALLEAVKAFKKIYDLAEPKFRDWEDAFKYMIPLAPTRSMLE